MTTDNGNGAAISRRARWSKTRTDDTWAEFAINVDRAVRGDVAKSSVRIALRPPVDKHPELSPPPPGHRTPLRLNSGDGPDVAVAAWPYACGVNRAMLEMSAWDHDGTLRTCICASLTAEEMLHLGARLVVAGRQTAHLRGMIDVERHQRLLEAVPLDALEPLQDLLDGHYLREPQTVLIDAKAHSTVRASLSYVDVLRMRGRCENDEKSVPAEIVYRVGDIEGVLTPWGSSVSVRRAGHEPVRFYVHTIAPYSPHFDRISY